MNFPKFADGHTDIHTEQKVTPKDPLRINAQDLKIARIYSNYQVSIMSCCWLVPESLNEMEQLFWNNILVVAA